MADVHDLVTGLAEGMGLDGIAFSENNVASIGFEDTALNFHAEPRGDELLLFLHITDIPTGDRLALYSTLLGMDAFTSRSGAVLGIDDEETGVFLSRRVWTKGMAVEELAEIVDSFLQLAEMLAAHFRGDRDLEVDLEVPSGIRV